MLFWGDHESRISRAFKVVVVVGVLSIIVWTTLRALDGAFSYADSWKILLDPVICAMIVLCPFIFRLIAKPLRDMDERQRKMDRALDNERKNLKTIFDASPVGMLLLDEALTVQKANQAMERIFASDVSDFIHQPLSVATDCKTKQGVPSGVCFQCTSRNICILFMAISNALESHKAVHGLEFELDRHTDGAQCSLWLLISAIPIETQGCLQILVSMQDITARCEQEKRIKEARDQAEQAKLDLEKAAECAKMLADEAIEANVAKSQFLSNMSHEIRTPMNSIVGFSDVLMDQEMTPQQRQYVEVIQKSSEHLLELINDILDLSKIEADKLEIEKIECTPRDLLQDIQQTFEGQCLERQLEFTVLCADEVPGKMVTDPTRLRQCLFNIVSNAIKFTEQGHVHVTASLVSEADGPSVRIDVEDTGIGISEDKQEQVFDAFTQADPETTRKYGGTGLGLAITRRLVHMLDGEMSCHSELGKGSVFSILLPVSPCGSPQNEPDCETVLEAKDSWHENDV